jgi:hypothetical protein
MIRKLLTGILLLISISLLYLVWILRNENIVYQNYIDELLKQRESICDSYQNVEWMNCIKNAQITYESDLASRKEYCFTRFCGPSDFLEKELNARLSICEAMK